MASAWNEDGHPSPPSGKLVFTFVHTCRSCFNPVISSYEKDAKTRDIVPGECPRWDAAQGSALDCNACRGEREELRERAYEEGRGAAAVRLFDSFFGARKVYEEYGDGYIDLQVQRELRAAEKGFVELSTVGLIQKDPEKFEPAHQLLALLLEPIQSDPVFLREWGTVCREEWQVLSHQMEWTYGLAGVLVRYNDPAVRAHKWMLVFTSEPAASRAWPFWPIPRRQALLGQWEDIIRAWEGGNVNA